MTDCASAKVTHVKYCKSLFFILYFMLGEIFPVVAEEGKYFFVDRDIWRTLKCNKQ